MDAIVKENGEIIKKVCNVTHVEFGHDFDYEFAIIFSDFQPNCEVVKLDGNQTVTFA